MIKKNENVVIFFFDYILILAPKPPPPPPHKINNNILTYLTSYGILQLAPPLSVIKIVDYCGVWGGWGKGGGAKIL